MKDEIVNRVANSGILSLDLEEWLPEFDYAFIDIKEQLFQELILREKDFRQFIEETNWAKFSGKTVLINCSVDAVIPTWAYMLLASSLAPFASNLFFGTVEEFENHYLLEKIHSLPIEDYSDVRVVIKGCSKRKVNTSAYIAIVQKLQPVAKSIMFGEPCSTVPIYKKKKA